MKGKMRQYFTIQRDSLFLEARNEFPIGDPVIARGRVDTDYPQGAEVPFILFPVAIGVFSRFPIGVFSRPDSAFPFPKIPRVGFEYLFSTSAGSYPRFCPWHDDSPLNVLIIDTMLLIRL
jgi:hypothetical protein